MALIIEEFKQDGKTLKELLLEYIKQYYKILNKGDYNDIIITMTNKGISEEGGNK